MTTKYLSICQDMINDYIFIKNNLIDMYEDLDCLNIKNYKPWFKHNEKARYIDNVVQYNQIFINKFRLLTNDEVQLIIDTINPIIYNTFMNINKKYSGYNRDFTLFKLIPLMNTQIIIHLESFYNDHNNLESDKSLIQHI